MRGYALASSIVARGSGSWRTIWRSFLEASQRKEVEDMVRECMRADSRIGERAKAVQDRTSPYPFSRRCAAAQLCKEEEEESTGGSPWEVPGWRRPRG